VTARRPGVDGGGRDYGFFCAAGGLADRFFGLTAKLLALVLRFSVPLTVSGPLLAGIGPGGPNVGPVDTSRAGRQNLGVFTVSSDEGLA
jgi:hypothetical protein